MEQQVMVDYLGKEIAPGHTVVYPGRKGSQLWISKGVVLDVNHNDGSLTIENEAGQKRRIERTDRVAVVS